MIGEDELSAQEALDKIKVDYEELTPVLDVKTALAILEQRLQNDASAELTIAAEEQRRITRLRLEKLLAAETR